MNDITQPVSTAPAARAAALLEAVGRDSEQAVDFLVPMLCGQAASRLYASLGRRDGDIPFLADDQADIAAAISEAITMLAPLEAGQVGDPIGEAITQARRALAIANEPGGQ